MSSSLGLHYFERCGLDAEWLDAREWLRSEPLPNASPWASWLSVNCACAPNPDMQVALAVGYGWHEDFTRAFRDQSGLTPEDVRARRSLANLPITEPIHMPYQPAKTMMPDRFVAGATMLF
jgi:AraC-like DNA-binding protein